jgi:hypothetical protein
MRVTLDEIRDGKIRIRDKHPGSATLDWIPFGRIRNFLG